MIWEWGGVYWSNWAGLSDVTRSMQTQRGLGASKVSSPSVGGTINVIVTRTTDQKKGGSVSYGIGNDGIEQYHVQCFFRVDQKWMGIYTSWRKTLG